MYLRDIFLAQMYYSGETFELLVFLSAGKQISSSNKLSMAKSFFFVLHFLIVCLKGANIFKTLRHIDVLFWTFVKYE